MSEAHRVGPGCRGPLRPAPGALCEGCQFNEHCSEAAMSEGARKAAVEKVYPTGYYYHGRLISAPLGEQFKNCPSPGDAMAEAKSSGRSVRDFTGGLNHPCGCGVGRNLLGEVPHGPCPTHGQGPCRSMSTQMDERTPVPWFVRVLYPDVVIPVLTMATIVAMSVLAIWRQLS